MSWLSWHSSDTAITYACMAVSPPDLRRTKFNVEARTRSGPPRPEFWQNRMCECKTEDPGPQDLKIPARTRRFEANEVQCRGPDPLRTPTTPIRGPKIRRWTSAFSYPPPEGASGASDRRRPPPEATNGVRSWRRKRLGEAKPSWSEPSPAI